MTWSDDVNQQPSWNLSVFCDRETSPLHEKGPTRVAEFMWEAGELNPQPFREGTPLPNIYHPDEDVYSTSLDGQPADFVTFDKECYRLRCKVCGKPDYKGEVDVINPLLNGLRANGVSRVSLTALVSILPK